MKKRMRGELENNLERDIDKLNKKIKIMRTEKDRSDDIRPKGH